MATDDIMIKIMLTCASALALIGCVDDEQAKLYANPAVNEIGVFQDCAVSFVNRGHVLRSFYIAKCPGTSTTITAGIQVQSGKSSTLRTSFSITQEIEKLTKERDAATAKEQALQKLTDTEKTLLGFK